MAILWVKLRAMRKFTHMRTPYIFTPHYRLIPSQPKRPILWYVWCVCCVCACAYVINSARSNVRGSNVHNFHDTFCQPTALFTCRGTNFRCQNRQTHTQFLVSHFINFAWFGFVVHWTERRPDFFLFFFLLLFKINNAWWRIWMEIWCSAVLVSFPILTNARYSGVWWMIATVWMCECV